MQTMNYHRKKFFFFPLVLAGIVLFTYVTMLLWNALLPSIFNFSAINFWQALGILALTRLLFGGMHSNWRRYRSGPYPDYEFRRKLKKMSPEERKEFFRKMHYERAGWNCGLDKEKYTENADSEKNEEEN